MGRPRVGVSRCLLGDAVRHDGGDKRFDWLVAELGAVVELVSVCPEVEIGLGVPREPIHLVAEPGRVALRGVTSNVDLTDRMQTWAAQRVEALGDLAGFVTKARSPSCGFGDAEVAMGDGGVLLANGLFVDALLAAYPDLVIADEAALAAADAREAFLRRVLAST